MGFICVSPAYADSFGVELDESTPASMIKFLHGHKFNSAPSNPAGICKKSGGDTWTYYTTGSSVVNVIKGFATPFGINESDKRTGYIVICNVDPLNEGYMLIKMEVDLNNCNVGVCDSRYRAKIIKQRNFYAKFHINEFVDGALSLKMLDKDGYAISCYDGECKSWKKEFWDQL